MIDTLNGALTLNQSLLREMREAPDVVRRGFLLVLMVGLLVGVVHGISSVISNAQPAQVASQVEMELDAAIEQVALSATTDEQRLMVQILNQNKEAIVDLVQAIVELPTPLPYVVGSFFQGLGLAASRPLIYLANLVIAVIVTHIAARQLGGQASIQQMLGLGALSVAPHALDALSFIPVLGSTLSMIAWFWGLVILIVATSVAHKLDSGRATLAVLLYPVLLSVLFFVGFCCFMAFAVISAAGGA